MPELRELTVRSEGVAGLVCEGGPGVFETLLVFVYVQVDVLGAADPVVGPAMVVTLGTMQMPALVERTLSSSPHLCLRPLKTATVCPALTGDLTQSPSPAPGVWESGVSSLLRLST